MRSYEMVVILQADLEDHKMVAEEIAEVVRGLGAELERWISGAKSVLPTPSKNSSRVSMFCIHLNSTQHR